VVSLGLRSLSPDCDRGVTDGVRQLKLAFAVYNQAVEDATAWRLPEARVGSSVDPAFLRHSIRQCEKGLFDYFFIPSILSSSTPSDIRGNNDPFRIDPMPLASYAAALTDRIGLAVTVNTTYQHPFDVARETASLDHLSAGRAAINLVTGAARSEAATNFGLAAHPDEDSKYDRAIEFTEVLHALWGSWDADWLEGDKGSGRLIRPGVVRPIDHHGEYFDVAGALTLPPPPQGQIPLIHAGISERSREFGSRFADVRFASFSDLETARREYADTKRRVVAAGRDPERHYVIPGLTIYVDETVSAARARFRQVQEWSTATLTDRVAAKLGVPAGIADPAARITDLLNPAELAMPQSLVSRAIDAFGSDDLTVGDITHYAATEARGQPSLVGSVTTVADWIEDAFGSGVLDGLKLYPPYLPGPLDSFVELVVPELQRRGLVRKSYDTQTFRQHFALPTPLHTATIQGKS
jgi:FMN-dependent oxidoreductase (nitrilotriacetate monooxygenase family)